jgi:DNA-binding CsgD family transcriptional regulator
MAWKSISARAQVDASHLARLVDHVEDDCFDEVLLSVLQEKGPAVEISGFLYAPRKPHPRPVSWCGRPSGTAARVEQYARQYHRFDPTLHSLPDAGSGRTFVDVLVAEDIADMSYRNICFEAPAFTRKISVAHAAAGGEWTVLNMYLGQECVGSDTLFRMASFGSLIAPFLRRRGRGPEVSLANDCERADERLCRKLRRRFPALTEREALVCALTMIGKTSEEIATALGIRPCTVITYRRRAYERLEVSSAAALVAAIL